MTETGQQLIIDQLAAENERLRNTVQMLINANRLMLDAIGLWTCPTIPNN